MVFVKTFSIKAYKGIIYYISLNIECICDAITNCDLWVEALTINPFSNFCQVKMGNAEVKLWGVFKMSRACVVLGFRKPPAPNTILRHTCITSRKKFMFIVPISQFTHFPLTVYRQNAKWARIQYQPWDPGHKMETLSPSFYSSILQLNK